MRRGGKDAAATCALEFGLSRLRRFPGIREICKARGQLIQHGDPEQMEFFDRFGTVDADTGGAGACEKPYKRHVPEALAKQIGQLAADLGMPSSQLAVLALMGAHLGATGYVKPRYQEAIKTTLERFRNALDRRAKRALAYAEAPPEVPETDARAYSMDDVISPGPVKGPTKPED